MGTLSYKNLVDEIEFEGRKFIPIIQLCANSILNTYEDFLPRVANVTVIHDSMEQCAVLTFKHTLLWVDTYECYYKVYWNYDTDLVYVKGSDDDMKALTYSKSETLSMKRFATHNTVDNVIDLYLWGFINDFEKRILLKK